jgi:5-methyltetrahydrofolate--homocysteine methyltransferase
MFTIIGERINTSRKSVQEAVAARDAAYIQDDVKKQQEAGAHYIDVNAGARIGHETEDMKWLLSVIQEAVSIPLCLDSPDPKVLEMAYGLVREKPMVNSISLEKERYDAMIPFLKGKDCRIVALCMDDTGMPKSSADIVDRAGRLVAALEGVGMKREDIYLDPLVQPISVETENGMMVLDAVRTIMAGLPGVHTTCGLSNISFGLPKRKFINRNFLTLMMAYGLDAAILDPLDREIMAVLRATEMLLGRDEYCGGYLKAVRAGIIA